MGRGKPIIGLCGGVGAGKSTIAQEFERLGGLVIDSDAINREMLNRPEILSTLISWWGAGIVDSDGRLDRARIANLVFKDEREKRRLESLLHPLIRDRHESIIREGMRDPKVAAIILDSPLLFESRLDLDCNAVVFVEAGESLRVRRIQSARTWDVEELRRRESCQASLAEKRARSRFVILNEGSIEQSRTQVVRVLRQIQAEYSSEQ